MTNIEDFKTLSPKLSLTRNFLSGGYSCYFQANKKIEQNSPSQLLSEWVINKGEIFLKEGLINLKGLSSKDNRLLLIEGEIKLPEIDIPSKYSIEIFTEFVGRVSKNNYKHKLIFKVSGVHLNQSDLAKEISETIKNSSVINKFEITFETIKEHFFSSLGLAPVVEESMSFQANFLNLESNLITNCDSLRDKNIPPVNNMQYFKTLSEVFLNL